MATFLMMDGSWSGPVVLLAPAGGLIARLSGFMSPLELHIPPSVVYARVVHSKLDKVVPVQDTINLITRTHQKARDLTKECDSGIPTDLPRHEEERIMVTIVDDDDHPLSKTMREERLREAVIEAYTFSTSRQREGPPLKC